MSSQLGEAIQIKVCIPMAERERRLCIFIHETHWKLAFYYSNVNPWRQANNYYNFSFYGSWYSDILRSKMAALGRRQIIHRFWLKKFLGLLKKKKQDSKEIMEEARICLGWMREDSAKGPVSQGSRRSPWTRPSRERSRAHVLQGEILACGHH